MKECNLIKKISNRQKLHFLQIADVMKVEYTFLINFAVTLLMAFHSRKTITLRKHLKLMKRESPCSSGLMYMISGTPT